MHKCIGTGRATRRGLPRFGDLFIAAPQILRRAKRVVTGGLVCGGLRCSGSLGLVFSFDRCPVEGEAGHVTEQLAVWDRPNFEPGGGAPFLFYVVFGDIDVGTPLSRSKYRSNGIPDGLEVTQYDSDEHADYLNGFRRGHIWEGFKSANSAEAARLEVAGRCLVLHGNPFDPSSLNYLRDAVGLLTFFLDHGGLAIYDPQMFQWWLPAAWREQVFDPAAAVPSHHVVILFSEEDTPDRYWYHTRGMRKFGRPDISVHNVLEAHRGAVGELCNRFIGMQASGATIPEGQEIRMDSLPPGGVVRHSGHLEDPDFNNAHIEILWPGSA